jgi:hypothetical protein
MGSFKVDLRARLCDCGKLQALNMPCSHVVAARSNFHHDYRTLIPEVFKIESVYVIYNKRFEVVHYKSCWPPYEGPKLCHDPAMPRLRKGRPNSTRIMTEMDVLERAPRKCGVCQKIDHIRKLSFCKNPVVNYLLLYFIQYYRFIIIVNF